MQGRLNFFKKTGHKLIPHFLKPFAADFYRGFVNFSKYGKSDFFTTVDFENITTCNRRCLYCPNSIYERGLSKNEKLMEEDVFKKMIKELHEINFSGMIRPVFYGEPLLDSRFPKWISYAREKLPKADIIIFTNGDFLTMDLYKKFVEAGTNLFLISNHNGEVMTKNLKDFLNNFKPVSHGGDYPYKGSFVHDIAYSFEDRTPDIFYRVPSRQKKLYNRGGLMKGIKSCGADLRCNLPSVSLTVDAFGNVILCCNDYFSTIKFGDLKNEKIMEIWKKKSFKKIRKDLKSGKLYLDICKKCKGVNA